MCASGGFCYLQEALPKVRVRWRLVAAAMYGCKEGPDFTNLLEGTSPFCAHVMNAINLPTGCPLIKLVLRNNGVT